MKARVSLRNHTIIILTLVFVMAGSMLAGGKAYAFGTGDLSVKGMSAYGVARKHGDAAAMDYIKECNSLHSGAIPAEDLEFMLDQGYLTGYVDELKSLGYISAGYAGGSSSAPAQTDETESTVALEPAAFTVEDMEDTPMWAVQVVNYRDGASTDYNKIGSLSEHEQVIVNGVASTGWYRFNTSDGTVAYVSDKYLTKEDPSNRELNVYNEETGQVDTYTFEVEDPEVVDETIEEIKEEYEDKEPVVEEPEPEPEPEETVEPEPAEESVVEPAVEEPSRPWQFYASIVCAVLCVVVISYVIIKKKRNKAE